MMDSELEKEAERRRLENPFHKIDKADGSQMNYVDKEIGELADAATKPNSVRSLR